MDAVYSGHSECSGIVLYGSVSAMYCIQCIHCVLCPLCDCIHLIHWFDLFAPKTISPPTYTTIPLHQLCTAYCIHCIHWFDLFASKTISQPPYTTIPLRPLCTVSTVYCAKRSNQWMQYAVDRVDAVE